MKISYGITVKDELPELISLCDKLERWLEGVNYEWEIVILKDYFEDPASPEFKEWEQFMLSIDNKLKSGKYSLNLKPFSINPDMSFAEHKNFLTSLCHGAFIFQIDADEYPSTILVQEIGTIIEQNPTVDLYWVPRVNTVYGLTHTHVQMWGWQMSTLENVELPVVNWPDYQGRIFRNSRDIWWEGKVHERITGTGLGVMTKLPPDPIWSLFHPKTISRQVKQNQMYSQMQR